MNAAERDRALEVAAALLAQLAPQGAAPLPPDPTLLARGLDYALAHPGKAPPGIGHGEMRGLPVEISAEDLSFLVQVTWFAAQWVEAQRQHGAVALAGKVLATARALAKASGRALVEVYAVVDGAARGLTGDDPAASLGSELDPATAPSWVLHVDFVPDGSHGRLRFWLDHFSSGVAGVDRQGPWDGPAFPENPGRQFEAIHLEARRLGDFADAHRLAALGARLGDLLPEPCHDALALATGGSRAPSLLILTSEPWVPWELVRLHGTQGKRLGECAALSVWPRRLPVTPRERLDRIGLITPVTRDLALVTQELARLKELAGPSRLLREVGARRETWLAALDSNGYDGWHFAGHGYSRAGNPESSGLQLDANETLEAGDLHPDLVGLGQLRPFVFLNACESAQAGWSLLGAQSVALAFLRAGAGTVLGTRWRVPDRAASTLAPAFYREWFLGLPLAEALRRVRVDWNQQYPGDSSALAYTALGHPLGLASGR